MTTYAGVTFSALAPDTACPAWAQEANISVAHIPYANKDDVQAAGRGNYQVEFTAHMADGSGIATLQAAVGITKRTLADFLGTSYANTMLIAAGNPRAYYSGDWLIDLTFMREGS